MCRPQLARRRSLLDWYEKTKGREFVEAVKVEILKRFEKVKK
jgi:hypothetical protein